MKFSIDPKIFERWPEVKLGIVVLTGLNNGTERERSVELLRKAEKEARDELKDKTVGELNYVLPWKRVYEDFGASSKKYLSSIEALLTRVTEGKNLPDINPLVNFYNYASLKHKLPFGGEDLDKVVGDVALTLATGTEKGKYIGGEKEEVCLPGEVIYKDKQGFICRRWNWREADRTKFTEETSNAIIVAELLPPVNEATLVEAVSDLAKIIEGNLGGEMHTFFLDKGKSSLEVDFKTGSKAGEAEGNLKSDVRAQQVEKIREEKQKFSYLKGSTAWQLQELIAKSVNGLYPSLNLDFEHVSLEHPAAEEHGDYSTNIALRLKTLLPGQKNPREIAEKIVQQIYQTTSTKTDNFIKKIEIAGPGFINIFLSKDWQAEQVSQVLAGNNDYGSNDIFKGKKVIVEFTDPNPFKEFHIGHLYSNTVGESISRLLEFSGAEVWRVNYQGDVGLHVAKSLWGLLRLKSERPKESASPSEKAAYLGRAYALGASEYEKDEKVKAEITTLNKKIYDQDPEIIDLYELGRTWSLDYFESIYQRLGTKFKDYFFEREAGKVGLEFVRENLKKGIFAESEGAIIFPGEKYGLHNRVFINSQGLPTYEAKDIGLAPTKYRRFPYDLSIIITGNEINEYFKVLLKALSLINPDLAAKTRHLSHGMVRLPEGKMSSRTGKVLTGEWLLDEAKRRIQEIMKERKITVSDEDNIDVAEKVAVGAIKYAFLKSAIGSDIEFDFGTSLSFDGDSGPYLQYTFARAKSVLRKSVNSENSDGQNFRPSDYLKVGQTDSLSVLSILKDEEQAILRYLYRFPEVVELAARTYSPNLICSYLFELAKRYNNLYNNCPILGNNFLLALTEATSIILKNGLNLLGIKALERM